MRILQKLSKKNCRGHNLSTPGWSTPHHPPQCPHNIATTAKVNSNTATQIMDLNVVLSDETHVIEVALADTVEDMRRKVASAVGLPEDSFDMSFGDEVMGEGADMTQLSAGDSILVTTTKRCEAIAALHALGETNLRPERLEEVRDPEVACLLLQAEVTTVIPKWFLHWASMTRLDLSAVSTVTRIESYFLSECPNLTSVDLSSFNSLTHVGDGFLHECEGLTSVDLSSFTSLTDIGGCFLLHCTSLTSVDLSSFTNVTHVREEFLRGCTSLTSVDLSSFTSLTHVGNYFLADCYSLTSLDLSSLNSLTHIEDGFLYCCSELSSLNLSSLNSVQHIGSDFCEETNLQTIHLSGCSAVVSRAVEEAGLSDLVVDARPKRKRDESPEEDCKRPRLSQ